MRVSGNGGMARYESGPRLDQDRQYFEPVPESAWTFPIGGYLPAQRWLKDRIGRTLGYEEQTEFNASSGPWSKRGDLCARLMRASTNTAAGR